MSRNSRPAVQPPVPAQWPGFPPPYWQAPGVVLYLGDVRECLRALPARSVHCCISSPPYWGLRDYGTGQWDGGSAECEHKVCLNHNTNQTSTITGSKDTVHQAKEGFRQRCPRCGAQRIDMQIGMEPSPDCGTHGQAQCGACFVCAMVEVFREVYRVLRDDGTCWLNLGDTFDGGQGMVPALVALALRGDGWKLVQDIIWYSPNKMPESVTNRCTKSHEHIFLLAKGQGYYYDSVAIEEEMISKPHAPGRVREERISQGSGGNVNEPDKVWGSDGYKNKRDVWVVPTQGYPGAHFATFSPRLITPCILAGTSEHGCCAACGKPWERVITKGEYSKADYPCTRKGGDDNPHTAQSRDMMCQGGGYWSKDTVGWRKVCGCRFYRLRDNVPNGILEELCSLGLLGAEQCQQETAS